MSVDVPEQSDEGREMEAFKGRATRGAAWTAFGYGGQQIVRLAANLVLTRLLFEEHFGLMALVGVVIAGINLFSDIGIGAALIQSERDDPRFVDTMWTIEIVRGIVLWLIACVIAGPVAGFYEAPILADLIRVAAFGSVIEGFRSTNYYTENRNLQMKGIVLLEVGCQLAGITVMITWASFSHTVWALVAGGLVSAVVSTVWSHVLLPGRQNRLHFERRAARMLYRFGRWILLSTLLMFLVGNADRLIFGKLVTMAVLGVYNIALNLALVPSTAMNRVSMGILFPLYSRFHQSGTKMLPIYRNARLPMMILGGWATAGIVAGGPTIIEILYDPRYIEAGWMLQILVAGLWFGVVLEGSNGVAVLALGHSRWTAIASAAKLVGITILVPLGWHLWEFPGAIIGFAASDVLRYLASLVGVLRFGLDDRVQDLKMTLLVAGSAFAGWFAVQLLTTAGWTNVAFHAVVIAVIVTAFWMPQHLQLWRRYKETGHLFFAEGN